MKKLKALILLSCTSTTLVASAEVNLKEAGYYKTWVDLELKTEKNIFQLRRTYKSRSLHRGYFGFGWCSDFEKKLLFPSPTQIVLRDCRQKTDTVYQKKRDRFYESLENPLDILEVQKTRYVRKTLLGQQQIYNLQGQLQILNDNNGFEVQLLYNRQGLPATLHIPRFGDLKLTYNTRLQIISVTTSAVPYTKAGGSSYKYSEGNLVAASLADGSKFTYGYDEVHNLTRITYPDHESDVLTYDKEKDWILSIRDRKQCLENYRYTRTPSKGRKSFQSTAERRCPGQKPRKVVYEFFNEKTKLPLRIGAKGNQSNEFTP